MLKGSLRLPDSLELPEPSARLADLEHIQASADLLLGLLHVKPGSLNTAHNYASLIRNRRDQRLPRKCWPWLKQLRQRDPDLLSELVGAVG